MNTDPTSEFELERRLQDFYDRTGPAADQLQPRDQARRVRARLAGIAPAKSPMRPTPRQKGSPTMPSSSDLPNPTRRNPIGSIALTALVLLVLGIAWFGIQHGGHPAPGPASHPTTPAVLPTLPPTGAPPNTAPTWIHTPALDGIQQIAWSASAPNRVYACVTLAGQTSVGIITSVTGGDTWTPPIQLAAGLGCFIGVDPTDASDVVVVVQPIAAGTTPGNTSAFDALYRSHDGGMHWTQASVPATASAAGFTGQLTWEGSTLFASTLPTVATTPSYQIAISVAGLPFAWVDAPGHPLPGTSRLDFIAGVPNALLIGIQSATTNGTNCQNAPYADTPYVDVYRSTDHGQTWLPTTLSVQGQSLHFVLADANSQAIVALPSDMQQYLVALDGGTTWTSTPAFQNVRAAICPPSIFVAPDGTVLAQFASVSVGQPTQPAPGIYINEQKVPIWKAIDTTSNALTLFALTCDAQGHPLILWARTNGGATGSQVVWLPV